MPEGRGKAEMAAECKKLNLENTLREANCEAMFPAEMEDLWEVVHMGREILAEDEDVIHEDKAFIRESHLGQCPSYIEWCS